MGALHARPSCRRESWWSTSLPERRPLRPDSGEHQEHVHTSFPNKCRRRWQIVGSDSHIGTANAQPVHTQCRGHVSMLRLGTRLLMREMSLNSLAPASPSQPRVTTCSSRDATRPAFTAAICTCALFAPPTPHTHPAHATSVEPRLAARYGTISLYRNVAIDYACKPKARPFMSTHSPPGTTTTSAV